MSLPKLNNRILQVIEHKTDGNISAFAKIIDVSQQKLDRLFKIDNRTQKVPTVPSEILVNITERFVDIDSDWLLMGHGEMLRINKTKSTQNVTFLKGDKKGDILEKNEKYRKGYPLDAESEGTETNNEFHDFRLSTDQNIGKQSIPLYNIEATAGLVSLFTETHNYIPIDFINIPNLPRCDGAIYVTGDSMYPLLKSGDIVLYKQINDIQNDIFWGEMYLISINIDGDEYITVKYIHKSAKEGWIKLVSHNPDHAEKELPVTKVRALAFVKASIRINSMK